MFRTACWLRLGRVSCRAFVSEHGAADAFTGLQAGPEGQRAHMGGHHRLEAAGGAKLHGRALIHRNENGLLPVLVKQLWCGGCPSAP